MATPDRVLDITTDRIRATVRIDQVAYPLRDSHDLTLDMYKTLERVSPRIGALLLLETLTKAQGSELGQLLEQACRCALVAPAVVHDRLGDFHRLNVFQVFMQLLTPSLGRAARAVMQGTPRATGRKPSRAFSVSTAAPSTAGSRPRRSVSSGRA